MVRSMPALSLLQAALLGTTTLTLAIAPPALARVGVTSATDGDPRGKPPTEAERVLRIGIDVQANEVITTGSNDRAHLVFLDGTSLTVGPGAVITIDKFVYDPNTKTGELAVNASKGVLRLVGGKISKTNPITITTPSSTIGIRGGITLVSVEPTRTTSTFVFGDRMTVSGRGQTQNVTRPGSQVTTNAGAPPGQPAMAPQGSLTGQMSQLEGTGGSNSQGNQGSAQGNNPAGGGNADQRAQQFSQQNSGQGPNGVQGLRNQVPPPANNAGNPNDIGPNILRTGGTPPTTNGSPGSTGDTTSVSTKVIVSRGRFLMEPSTGVIPTGSNNQLLQTPSTVTTRTTGSNTTNSITITTNDNRSITLPWKTGTAGGGFTIDAFNDPTFGRVSGTGYVSADGDFFAYVFTDTNNRKLGFFGGTPTATVPVSGFGTYTINSLGNSGRLPFASGTAGDDSGLKASADISKMLTAYSQSLTIGQPVTDNRSVAMQSTISISGSGTSQKSYMGVLIGFFVPDGNTSTAFSANFNGTYRMDGSSNVGRLSSAESTPTTGAGNAIYGNNAANIVMTPDQLSTTYTTSGGNVDSFSTTRTAQASSDYVNGALSATTYYNVNTASQTSTSTTAANSRTSQTLSGFVSGLVDQMNSSGAYAGSRAFGNDANGPNLSITTDAGTNRASATVTQQSWASGVSATFNLGSTTGTNAATGTFIDDKNYAATTSATGTPTSFTGTANAAGSSSTVLVSGAANPTALDGLYRAANTGVASSDPNYISQCTCSFLTWGWWAGGVTYSSTSGYNPSGTDTVHLAPYVAGTLTDTTTLTNMHNSSTTATYKGDMIGNVRTASGSYVAVGGYSNTFNFGTNTGTVNITNFDGVNYTGTNSVTGNTITGTFSNTNAGRSGTLNGAFFGSGAAGQAGTFGITNTTGSSYNAAGTFKAQK